MKYSPSCYSHLSWLFQSCLLLICSLVILTSCSSDSVSTRSDHTPHTLHQAAIQDSPLHTNLVSHQGNHSSNQTTIDHVPHQETRRNYSHLQQLERCVGLDQYQIRRRAPQDDTTSLVALLNQPRYNTRTIRHSTPTKEHMYTILQGKTPVIDCDDLQTAIRFVQSLESGIDRHTHHSPYTIVKAEDVTRPGVKVGAPDFVVTDHN